MRRLNCSDLGFQCDAVIEQQTDDEVLAIAGPHAKEAHGVNVTPDMAEQIRGQIQTV